MSARPASGVHLKDEKVWVTNKPPGPPPTANPKQQSEGAAMPKYELSHPLQTNPRTNAVVVFVLTQTDRYGKTTVLNAGTRAFVQKQQERYLEMDRVHNKHYEYMIAEEQLYNDDAEPIKMELVREPNHSKWRTMITPEDESDAQ